MKGVQTVLLVVFLLQLFCQ